MNIRHIDGMKGLDETTSFAYHIDGQLAERKGSDSRESFYWDGLALIKRGETSYINDPSVTGGNPILADNDVLFNDMLGTTLGTYGKEFKEINRTTFGSGSEKGFFTGKPYVKELGAVFLFRNYRPELGKWQTSDPLGYPDGWNNFAYGNNKITTGFDSLGGAWDTYDMTEYYYRDTGPDYIDTDLMGLTGTTLSVLNNSSNDLVNNITEQITEKVENLVKVASADSGDSTTTYNTSNVYNLYAVCYAFGMGAVFTYSSITYSWETVTTDEHTSRVFGWASKTTVSYEDSYQDPVDVGIELGNPYGFGHTWLINLSGSDSVLIE